MASLAYAIHNYPIGLFLYSQTRLDKHDAVLLMTLSLACIVVTLRHRALVQDLQVLASQYRTAH